MIKYLVAAVLAVVPVVGMAQQPPAHIYANYTRGQVESSSRLVEVTKDQLADCNSQEKDYRLEQASLLLGIMERVQVQRGSTEQGFRKVALYQDAVVANLGHAVHACAAPQPSTKPFKYLIHVRVRVTSELIDGATKQLAACDSPLKNRDLERAGEHLKRMRRIADEKATARALTEVSTEQNFAAARVARALQTCK